MTFRNHIRITQMFALLFVGSVASAQTITVTMCRDVVDVPNTATIADLPGPDGKVSMNEALLASDNTPGVQTIGFAIPESEWWLASIFPGQVLLQSTFGWRAFESVIIDGTTQTAFTGDTFSGGHEMSLDGLSLILNGDDSEIFGFHGCHVSLAGDNSSIHDNTGGMTITVGPFNSGCTVRNNEAGTINITYSDNNLVIRNTAERVRITGLNFNDRATGNRVGGPDPADRNYITGWGNVGEHGTVAGDTVQLYSTDDTLIQNNYIGTTPDGMAIGNFASTAGIAVHNDNHNLMIRDNLIATQAHLFGGASGPAIGSPIWLVCYEGATNIQILGNTLGLNALGEPVLGGETGIRVETYMFEDGGDVQVGGPNPGDGNVIAGHELSGVIMYNSPGVPSIGTVRVSGNSMYANGELGIDLMPNTWTFGPTANDALDVDDIGANGLQNYPVIQSAITNGSSINIAGNLASSPNDAFTIEFFASPLCDDSGFGEGQMYLGAVNVITDAAGDADFDVNLTQAVQQNWFLTATATLEPVGATSEFSACTPIENGSPMGDLDGDGFVSVSDLFQMLAAWGSCGTCPQDLTQDGVVNVSDLFMLLSNWSG